MDNSRILIICPECITQKENTEEYKLIDFLEATLLSLDGRWRSIIATRITPNPQLEQFILNSPLMQINGVQSNTHEDLSQIVTKYTQNGIYPYDISIVCELKQEQLSGGNKIRRIWCTKNEKETRGNYELLGSIMKPEFTYSLIEQLPHILSTISEDSIYLAGHLEVKDNPENYNPNYQQKKLPTNQKLRVKYYFHEAKERKCRGEGWNIGDWRMLIEPLMVYYPLHLQEPWDVFFHKLSEIIVDELVDNKHHIFTQIKQYLAANNTPRKVVLDAVSNVEMTIFRKQFLTTLSQALSTPRADNLQISHNICIKIPWNLYIQLPLPNFKERVLEEMEKEKINFPLIVKTELATRSKYSHQIGIIFNQDGLDWVIGYEGYKNTSLVLQQYIDHSQSQFKIYLYGNKVQYYTKTSLPYILPQGNNYLIFNSALPFPLEWYSPTHQLEEVKINEEFITQITLAIGDYIGLRWFGLDIIVDRFTLQYYIIDINYFPSFKNVPNFNTDHKDYIWNSWNESLENYS